MVGSEIAQLRESIANEYRAAQLGLSGLAYGISRHDFITSKLERIGTYHEQLQTFVEEDQAMGLVAETLESLPDTTTRQHILDLLPDEHGQTEATAHLEKQLRNMWDTMDLLKEHLGAERAQKIILAPVMLPNTYSDALAPSLHSSAP